jgi:hypothetical protein
MVIVNLSWPRGFGLVGRGGGGHLGVGYGAHETVGFRRLVTLVFSFRFIILYLFIYF